MDEGGVDGGGGNVIVKTRRIPTLLWKQCVRMCLRVCACVREGERERKEGGREDERRERKREMKNVSYCMRAGQTLKPSLIFRVKTSIFSHSIKLNCRLDSSSPVLSVGDTAELGGGFLPLYPSFMSSALWNP